MIGGLRTRLIRDNLVNRIEDNLDLLGWFDTGRQHDDIEVLPEPLDNDSEALPNKITVSFEEERDKEFELGSYLSEHTHKCYVDIYAESLSLGFALSGDVKDIIAGRFTTIGQSGLPSMSVLDVRLATPSHLFYVQFENLSLDRSRAYNKPFQKFWWVVSFDLIDYYSTEEVDG